jgi:hypothetical protein
MDNYTLASHTTGMIMHEISRPKIDFRRLVLLCNTYDAHILRQHDCELPSRNHTSQPKRFQREEELYDFLLEEEDEEKEEDEEDDDYDEEEEDSHCKFRESIPLSELHTSTTLHTRVSILEVDSSDSDSSSDEEEDEIFYSEQQG